MQMPVHHRILHRKPIQRNEIKEYVDQDENDTENKIASILWTLCQM